MNQFEAALVALHHLLVKADGAQSHWLDWSRGRLARLPDGLVEVTNNCEQGEAERTFVNSKVLLDLYRDGLVALGRPVLHGLILTEEGNRRAKRLSAETRVT